MRCNAHGLSVIELVADPGFYYLIACDYDADGDSDLHDWATFIERFGNGEQLRNCGGIDFTERR